ncbi:hypothetical protein MTO96_014097 [Rhipicephalus appendiculatus]
MSQARFSLSDFDDSELPPWSPEFYDTDGFSPPSQPSTLRGAGKRGWRRRIGQSRLNATGRKLPENHHRQLSDAYSKSRGRRTGRTPVVPTPTHRSHGRAQKRPHQLASTPAGRLRQSPPRKIIVFSKPRSLSPPPRIDDFSDITPVEVILFDSPPLLLQSSRLEPPRESAGRVTTSSPEKTKPASYIPARHKSPPKDSPTPQVSVVMSVPEETDERQASPAQRLVAGWVTFEKIWVFCVVASATLLLPFAMFILSYLLTPIRDASESTAEPSISQRDCVVDVYSTHVAEPGD